MLSRSTSTATGTAAALVGVFLIGSGGIAVAPDASAPSATAVVSASPSALPISEPQIDVARDELFELTLSTPRSVWTAGEPIEIDTTLAYIGSEPEIAGLRVRARVSCASASTSSMGTSRPARS